jgi:hypothetical protein
MKSVRVALLSLAAAMLILAVSGCAGQLPPSLREEPATGTEASGTATSADATSPTAEPTRAGESEESTATQYSGTITEDGVALGAEIQRTAAGDVGIEGWVMSTAGKAELVGPSPQLMLIAVGKSGKKQIWAGAATAAGSGALSSQEMAFRVKVPAGTTKLILSTTLHRQGSKAAAPALEVPVEEIPLVKTIDVTSEGVGE